MPYCRGSLFNTPPPPCFSSSSTELTFKLQHQLLCQTRCDFPSLHLPSLPTGAVAFLAAFSALFPAPSVSLLCRPIHKIPASQEALLQVGNTGPHPSLHSLPRWPALGWQPGESPLHRPAPTSLPLAPKPSRQPAPLFPQPQLFRLPPHPVCPSLAPPKSLTQGCTLCVMFICIWPKA